MSLSRTIYLSISSIEWWLNYYYYLFRATRMSSSVPIEPGGETQFEWPRCLRRWMDQSDAIWCNSWLMIVCILRTSIWHTNDSNNWQPRVYRSLMNKNDGVLAGVLSIVLSYSSYLCFFGIRFQYVYEDYFPAFLTDASTNKCASRGPSASTFT